MDINDVIIIKFIVTYYCLSACSIHWYGEAIAHARHKLKPCLLLSNRCLVEYINHCARSVSLSLSLKYWLTKSQVLFAVVKFKVTYTRNWLQLAEPILSAESARSLRPATATIARFSTNIADTVRAPFSSYTRDDRALQTRGTNISYSQPLFVVALRL